MKRFVSHLNQENHYVYKRPPHHGSPRLGGQDFFEFLLQFRRWGAPSGGFVVHANSNRGGLSQNIQNIRF
jgi:hypothetical protein